MAIGNRHSKLWPDLPQCLLELILERLIPSVRRRFGSVCRSWRTAQLASQIPFLVFRRNNSTERSIEFFSLSEKRIYKVPMPDCGTPMHRVLCVSSSHGWLLFRTIDGVKSGFLFNPFNKKCIYLPNEISFRTFYFNDNHGIFKPFNPTLSPPSVNFGVDISSIFFSTPANPDGILYVKGLDRFILRAVKDPRRSMPYNRIFYKNWDSHFQYKNVSYTSNPIFCEGKLYALEDNWSLAVIDPLFPHNISNVKMKNLKYIQSSVLQRNHLRKCKFILVESCGEILLVIMMGDNWVVWGQDKLGCEVFRADLTQMQWVTLQNLDDRILFLTSRSSISICASGTGCKGNRIYYIPSHKHVKKYVEVELGTDKITLHSIPIPDVTMNCEWLAPCLFP